MTEAGTGWKESDTSYFLKYGESVTPSRAEQHEMMAALVPAGATDRFLAVDLACGDGGLTEALLQHYPACTVLALDGSDGMLTTARARLAEFGGRVEFGHFDFRKRAWLDALREPVRCFVSSLAIHHLDGAEKQKLFGDLREKLEPGGALLILDLVEPVNEYARRAYAAAWDAAVHDQAEQRGEPEAYQFFRDGWNYFVKPDEEFDKPSPLVHQLDWLRAAGFASVDCFWLRAGHALYGGYVERLS